MTHSLHQTRPRIWFHIHIPKTAGSTLRQILARNFGKGYFGSVSLLEHRKLGLEETDEIVRKHYRWLRCNSDHRLTLDLPFESEIADVRALAFVRNPVDQVISQFNFQKANPRRKTDVLEMTIEEFVERKFGRAGNRSMGLQSNRIRGQKSGRDLEAIKKLLDDEKLFLFPLEEFDLACACMEARFPEEFGSMEYEIANRSSKRDQPDEMIRQKIGELVSADFDLHNIATWFVSTMATSVIGSPTTQAARLNEFRRRCQQFREGSLNTGLRMTG